MGRTWRAYLRHARAPAAAVAAITRATRIGRGPWVNARGVRVGRGTAAELHAQGTAARQADVAGDGAAAMVNGRGDTAQPPRHPHRLAGRRHRLRDGEDRTCANWTSNGAGSAQWGTTTARGRAGAHLVDSAHASRGCGQENLRSTGAMRYFTASRSETGGFTQRHGGNRENR
jgi:hypothetical protein